MSIQKAVPSRDNPTGYIDLVNRAESNSELWKVGVYDASGNQITQFGGGTVSGVISGSGGGGGQQYAEDAAHVTGDLGTLALAVRKDTAAQIAGTDGDYTALITDANGKLHVNPGTVAVTGTFWQATQPVSLASAPLPTGAATEASLAKLPISQSTALGSNSQVLFGGSVTTAAPTYTTGNINPISLDTSGNVRVALGLSEAHLGRTAREMDTIVVTPTISTTPYSGGDIFGGKITIANAVRLANESSLLHGLTLLDLDNNKPNLEVIFFSQDPNTGTYTDNAVLAFNASDIPYFIARIPITGSDWLTVGTMALATVTGLDTILKSTNATSLFAIIIITTTSVTYTNTARFTIKFHLEKN